MGTFQGPYERVQFDPEPPFNYFLGWRGIATIKRDGSWTTVGALDHYEIDGLVEGVDYFYGGVFYEDVDSSILDELESAGIGTVTR